MAEPRDDMTEPEPTEEELAQAKALARALSRGHVTDRDQLPLDALQTAAFLRHGHAPERPAEQHAAGLSELMQSLPEPQTPKPRRLGWLYWLVPAMAATAVWFLVQSPPETSRRPGVDAALLAAQAAMLESPAGQARQNLKDALRAYRGSLFERVRERAMPGDAGRALAALDAAHRRADEALDPPQIRSVRGELSRAVEAVAKELTETKSPLLIEAAQDGYFRLAELEEGLAEHREAQRSARRGLTISREPSLSVSNLWIIKAQAEEAAGDLEGAAQSLMNALSVNETLMQDGLRSKP